MRPVAGGSGPSIHNKAGSRTSPLSFGCANQRNLAAMVDNPTDWCSRVPKHPPICRGVASPSRNIAGHHHHDHLSRGPTGPNSATPANDQLRASEHETAAGLGPSADDHIAPAPRVSVRAFCETVETAAAVQAAGEDRRLGKAHLKIQMGGMAAAVEAYRSAPTPNVIILETEGRNDILPPVSISSPPCATPAPG